MSIQSKHRYLNSFFITSILYLISSFFLFYVFADTIIIEEKPEEVKISIKHMMEQETTPVQPIETPPPEPEPKPEPVVEKKIEKPKKEKPVEQKKPVKEPIIKKQEIVETKSEVVPVPEPIQKPIVEEAPVKQQMSSEQTEDIKTLYLSKITQLIEKNKTYPKSAKRLNQTGKVYVTFIIEKNGEIKSCKIHKSSQFESLDNASLEILSKITKFNPIPEELNKNSWEITVPIVYKIN